MFIASLISPMFALSHLLSVNLKIANSTPNIRSNNAEQMLNLLKFIGANWVLEKVKDRQKIRDERN